MERVAPKVFGFSKRVDQERASEKDPRKKGRVENGEGQETDLQICGFRRDWILADWKREPREEEKS